MGPLLFLLFIDDLAQAVHETKVVLFADDTNMLLIEKYLFKRENPKHDPDFITVAFIGTMKSFLEHNKVGRYNPEEMKQKEEKRRKEEEANEIAAKAVKVGDRCEVRVPGQSVRRATVMFIGKAHKATASC
jgi:tubulin-folding cofactor B